VLDSDGDLACLDTGGKVVWQKNLAKEFGEGRGRWAYSESPLIDGNVLVCTPGSAKASLAALDKKTGAVIWTSEVPEAGEAAYASAVVAAADGVKQYVQLLRNGVVGVAAKDGKPLWRFDKTATPTNCSTPIVHDGYIYSAAAGPGGGGTVLLRLGADGIQQVYLNKGLMNHHGGVVRVGDYVYGTTGRVLVCQEFKTGKVIWEDRSVGKGSVSAADGRLYVRGENGQVALVEATPDGYREKGRFDQPDRSQQPAWPHPVIAGGRLYLRDGDILLCYDIRAR
jgi:outer membrane protein assembly factor BamB